MKCNLHFGSYIVRLYFSLVLRDQTIYSEKSVIVGYHVRSFTAYLILFVLWYFQISFSEYLKLSQKLNVLRTVN